jgi:hypothetical protein
MNITAFMDMTPYILLRLREAKITLTHEPKSRSSYLDTLVWIQVKCFVTNPLHLACGSFVAAQSRNEEVKDDVFVHVD